MQDVLYKTLVSGHNIGGVKQKDEHAMCARCRLAGRRVEETLEHAYATCSAVAMLWAVVLRRWNAATGQALDATDLRVTLLGDRGEQTHALSEGLWRMVHASTVWAVHCAAKGAREHPAVLLSRRPLFRTVRFV